jgi:hypothetical protein
MKVKKIAGMSMKGGKKDKFFFCLLEYYPDKERWFLKSLIHVKDEKQLDGDDAIRTWIKKYELKKLIVDFPLSSPYCQTCDLDCPGSDHCPVDKVKQVRENIDLLLTTDFELMKEQPKKYENDRVKDNEIDVRRDVLDERTDHHILSVPFKRRLRRGFLPYWNRGIDFWIWTNYYDQLLKVFNISYDSFGNTSLMILSRFSYLKRHFPDDLKLFETNIPIILIELLFAKIINKNDLYALNDLEKGGEARLSIIKKIEHEFKLFIYEHDLEILVKNPRSFDSFLLALTGQRIFLEQIRKVPDWACDDGGDFVAPIFS